MPLKFPHKFVRWFLPKAQSDTVEAMDESVVCSEIIAPKHAGRARSTVSNESDIGIVGIFSDVHKTVKNIQVFGQVVTSRQDSIDEKYGLSQEAHPIDFKHKKDVAPSFISGIESYQELLSVLTAGPAQRESLPRTFNCLVADLGAEDVSGAATLKCPELLEVRHLAKTPLVVVYVNENADFECFITEFAEMIRSQAWQVWPLDRLIELVGRAKNHQAESETELVPFSLSSRQTIPVKLLIGKRIPKRFELQSFRRLLDDSGQAFLSEVSCHPSVLQTFAAQECKLRITLSENKLAPSPPQAPAQPLLLHHNLRSGTRLEHSGDVIIYGDLKHGAILRATGNVVIFGRCWGEIYTSADSIITAFDLRPAHLEFGGLAFTARHFGQSNSNWCSTVCLTFDNTLPQLSFGELNRDEVQRLFNQEQNLDKNKPLEEKLLGLKCAMGVVGEWASQSHRRTLVRSSTQDQASESDAFGSSEWVDAIDFDSLLSEHSEETEWAQFRGRASSSDKVVDLDWVRSSSSKHRTRYWSESRSSRMAHRSYTPDQFNSVHHNRRAQLSEYCPSLGETVSLIEQIGAVDAPAGTCEAADQDSAEMILSPERSTWDLGGRYERFEEWAEVLLSSPWATAHQARKMSVPAGGVGTDRADCVDGRHVDLLLAK